MQDDSLDSRGHFENRANPKNPRNRKQFGAQLDGPLYIPGLYDGRNKTFFMLAYEGVRAEAITSPFGSVPTALMRQGNFSEVATPIRNPSTGQPFPGNIIPRERTSPVALSLLEYYPAPSRAGLASNLQAPSAASDDVDQILTRVDQNLGNKVRLSLRFNWHDSYVQKTGSAPAARTGISSTRPTSSRTCSRTRAGRTTSAPGSTRAVPGPGAQSPVRRLEDQEPRPQLLQQHAAAGTGARGPAPSRWATT